MKRLAINVTICLGSFAVGVAVASVLTWINHANTPEPPKANVAVVNDQPATTSVPEPAESPLREVFFDEGLRIVPTSVKLKSERFHYEIDMTYPQIVGSEAPHFQRLNKQIKQLVAEKYEWQLNPTEADLQRYQRDWPEASNSVYLDYEVTFAREWFLSIYFYGYSYGIGAAHSVQFSFVVNYDSGLEKQVKLTDIFRPRSKYMKFISAYCLKELSKYSSLGPEDSTLNAEFFKNWNFTSNGIRFTFDACTIFPCAEGKHQVDIPLHDLKEFLTVEALDNFGGHC